MRRILALVPLVLIALSCASRAPQAPPVMVPPQIDLKEHETIGVIRFDSSSKGQLGPMATRRFTEAARRDQGLVRILDLGSREEALRSIGRDRLDADAMIALGKKNGVKTIVTGDLVVSNVKPNVSVDALFRSGSVTAQVDATLEVQLFEVDSGAALWNRSGTATHTVGNVSMWGGRQFAFDARDPDDAYGELVDDLVTQVSRPFQVTWVRR
ncbi:MAG TPA: hypothetical protein VFB67_00850 [Candidatus Polarisedimenticolaceae bacterium]|nr:hypothetical protein [Candidatus Polarisedimenticolaceae bacterium]